MEDEKIYPEGEGEQELEALDAQGESAEQDPCEEKQESNEGEETPALELTCEEPTPDWEFGEEELRCEKRSTRRFFAIFGGVFGACAVMLILMLFLGESGFKFTQIREIYRTVFVREDGSAASDLLSPQEAADKIKRSTVTVSVKTPTSAAIGSGFIYTADGYIITNQHVVAHDGEIQVILDSGAVYDAELIGSESEADVAVLKINATDLPVAECGVSAGLLAGDDVVAIGTPAKLDYAGTATFGKVSANSRLLQLTDAKGNITKKMTMIQTDTLVNNGNSGGPLGDMYGRVVGVVVMKLSYYGGNAFDGIGFALPIDGVRKIADEIIKHGKFTGKNPIAEGRSLLGVTGHGCVEGKWYAVDPINSEVTTSDTEQPGFYRCDATGIYVSAVNGGNAKGIMQEGDIILKINGLRMMTIQDVIAEANRHYASETLTLEVYRNGQIITLKVGLIEEGAP